MFLKISFTNLCYYNMGKFLGIFVNCCVWRIPDETDFQIGGR